MSKHSRSTRATFGRSVIRRALVITVVMTLAAVASTASRFREQAAHAAAPQATPTPAPTPDYSNVDDVLSGRRHLLRTDDIVVTSVTEGEIPIETKRVLLTDNSQPVKTVGAADYWNPSLRWIKGPVAGRMFNLPQDVLVTGYTFEFNDDVYFMVDYGVSEENVGSFVNVGMQRNSRINSLMMADFNKDGYGDLVLNWTCDAGESCSHQNGLAIVTANDVNNLSAGLKSAQTNYNTTAINNMVVGDFNGDGQPDIIGVEAGADGTGLRLAYHTVDPKTFAISDAVYLPTTNPISTAGKMIRISAAGGRFTDELHDQLVVAYYTDAAYYPGSNGVRAVVIDFDASMNARFGPVLDARTTPNNSQTVIKVQTGRFDWSSRYDQVAFMVAWWGDPEPQGVDWDTKWIEVDTVNPQDLSIKRGKLWEFSDQDCGFDFTAGNFDRTRTIPNSQETERDPNLQLALVFGSCESGYKGVQLYNVDPTNGFELSHAGPNYSLPNQDDPSSYNYSITAGDTQGRSLVLGEPTKIILDGTTQPTAVIAAPPMHADFMNPADGTTQSLINLSAVPEGFNTFFDFDSSSSTKSSTTHTTSWTFSAKEKVEGSGTFGLPLLDESTVKDTFTAAQNLKGSAEKEQGSYANLNVDITQKTGLFDQVAYSQTRFTIWSYPVIGRTVCPATKPGCQESEKVPLTMLLSGPDQISNDTIAGSQLEWYQPTWEYGNVLSYPGSYSQLLQIVPDLDKLSSDQTWFTDTSQLTQKTSWSNGSSTSQTSSFNQNYSFENDLSVSSTWGAEGADAGSFEADLDIGGSFGLKSLIKSSTDTSESNGIGINKPGSFADPFSYGYSVTPYIFGRKQPDGSFDNVPLTGNIKTSGLLQTAFVVDPLGGSAGGWWKQAYTAQPDVALNHPTRWVVTTPGLTDPIQANCLATGTGASQMNCVNLAPSSPANPWMSEFHNMRGFFISDARSPGQGPQLETAKAGDKLTLQARVYNYSLAPMDSDSKVHARFYGQVWNTSNNTPAGDGFLIGEDVLGPIPPFSTDAGADLNFVYAGTNFDTTPYQDKHLVFWVVVWAENADGALAPEIAGHGLTALPGTLKSLADVQSEQYGNNVGFYKSAFYISAPDTSVAANLARQSGPGDVRMGPVRVSTDKIKRGQPVEVSAQLRAWARGANGISVVFYDGDPQKGGRAFDVERVSYVSPRTAHEVRVPFRSNTCGEHRLFVTVGRGKPYEVTGSSRPVTVRCEAAPPARSAETAPGSLSKGAVGARGATFRREAEPTTVMSGSSATSGRASRRFADQGAVATGKEQ